MISSTEASFASQWPILRAPVGPLAGAPGVDSPGAALARRPLLDGDGPDHPGRLMRDTDVLVGPGRVERMGEFPLRLDIARIPCLGAARQGYVSRSRRFARVTGRGVNRRAGVLPGDSLALTNGHVRWVEFQAIAHVASV